MTDKIEITMDDAEKLETIMGKFTENIEKMVGPHASSMLASSFLVREKFGTITAMYRHKFNKNSASPEKRAKATIGLCNAMMPGLKRAFGEWRLVNAVPEEAHDPRIVKICEQINQDGFADIVRQAVQRKKPQSPTFQPS